MSLPEIVHRPPATVHKHRHGFTLIEILVVVTILGLLTTLGAFSFSKSLQKARDSKRKNDLQSIRRSLEGYFQKYGSYPPQDGSARGKIMCDETDYIIIGWGDPFICTNSPTYETITFMPNLPKDPLNTAPYIYSYLPTFSDPKYFSYVLQAQLENTNDPDLSNLSCTPTLGYNYCVTNP